jgi:protein SCO1/2
MPARARLVLMAVASVVLVGALVAVLAIDPDRKPERSHGFAGATRPAIEPLDFRLRDQDGRPATLSGYRGQVVVLTFLYSTCEDTCPVTASQIRGALDDLGEKAPPAMAISVDPAHDTPRSARTFLVRQRLANGRMRFLLGSRRELAPVWKAYGIRPQGEGFEHSAYVVLIDARGRQRIGFPFDKLTPEGLEADVRRLQQEAASAATAASARSSAAT